MTNFLIILGFALAIAFAIWARYESSDVHHLKSQLEAIKEFRVHGNRYEFYCPFKTGDVVYYLEDSYHNGKWKFYTGIVADIQFTRYNASFSRYSLYCADLKWVYEGVNYQKIFTSYKEAQAELNKLNND